VGTGMRAPDRRLDPISCGLCSLNDAHGTIEARG
jgi:hypothetical protein